MLAGHTQYLKVFNVDISEHPVKPFYSNMNLPLPKS